MSHGREISFGRAVPPADSNTTMTPDREGEGQATHDRREGLEGRAVPCAVCAMLVGAGSSCDSNVAGREVVVWCQECVPLQSHNIYGTIIAGNSSLV